MSQSWNNRNDRNDRNDRYPRNDRFDRNDRNQGNKKRDYDTWSNTRQVQDAKVDLDVKKVFYTTKPGDHSQFLADNEITTSKNISPIMSFDELKNIESDSAFVNKLIKQLNTNFQKPTPIQAQSWSIALGGNDLVGVAQTGSGKTLSFVVPALVHAYNQQNDRVKVLVLAPTRELTLQIQEVFMKYEKLFNMRSCCVYGGVSSYNQKRDLRDGVDIVIATPGRLIDLYEQGALSLSHVTFLVLDEADRMLDMGFEPQLKRIIPNVNEKKQTLMWSATWPKKVRNLALSYMEDYVQINVGQDELTINKKIKQEVRILKRADKRNELLNILNKKALTIVFVNTKRMCDDIEYFLREKGFKATAIHGDKTQNVRDRVISDFKTGYFNILLATDVAARGLDVSDVELVVNFDFPKDCEDYVHRIGRTGRGGKSGQSVTFFSDDDSGNAKKLVEMLKDAGQEVNEELIAMSRNTRRGNGGGSYNNYQRRRW